MTELNNPWEIENYLVDYTCDEVVDVGVICHSVMKAVDDEPVLLSSPPRYLHICEKGHRCYLTVRYPDLRWRFTGQIRKPQSVDQ